MAKNYDPSSNLFGSMQKVNTQPKEVPVVKEKESIKKPAEKTVVKEATIEVKPSKVEEETIISIPDISIDVKPVERKTEHKNILVTKTLAKKIEVTSKRNGISENALINMILEQALKDM